MVDSTTDNDKSPMRRKDDHLRLESWKSIAKHLNRSVRTVRRWEASDGLPVRRHQHGKGASVYAYQVELDAWADRRRDQEELVVADTVSVSQEDAPAHPARWKMAAAIVAAFGLGVMSHSFYDARWGVRTEQSSPQTVDASVRSSTWAKSTAKTLATPVFEFWADGEIEKSLEASLDLQHRMRDVQPEVREQLAALLVQHAVSLGRTTDAMVIAEAANDPNHRSELRAMILFASGQKAAMRDELVSLESFQHESTALLLAMAGLADKALAGNAQLGTAEEQRQRALVIEGMAAMQAGDLAAARSRLNVAALTLDIKDQAFFFVALDMLSGLHLKDGELGLAIEVLEDTMGKRRRAATGGSGVFWLMCQWQLAKLYDQDKRNDDAGRIDAERQRFMSLADETFPLARASLKS